MNNSSASAAVGLCLPLDRGGYRSGRRGGLPVLNGADCVTRSVVLDGHGHDAAQAGAGALGGGCVCDLPIRFWAGTSIRNFFRVKKFL